MNSTGSRTTLQFQGKVLKPSVFSSKRDIKPPLIKLPPLLKPNKRLKMDGLEFLSLLPERCIPVAFLDPQYRGVLDKLAYGNEGKGRGKARCEAQADERRRRSATFITENKPKHSFQAVICFFGWISFTFVRDSVTG